MPYGHITLMATVAIVLLSTEKFLGKWSMLG